MRVLLSKGANIEAKNNIENTAFHLAAENEKTEVMEFLLSKGANIEAKNKYE